MPPLAPSVSEATAEVENSWMAAMRRGDFEAAWQHTDRHELVRRAVERDGRFVWSEEHLIWNGAPFAEREVVVRCNHGLGDTLQFIRYVPWLREVTRSVEVLVQPSLVELLRTTPNLGQVRNGWTDEPVAEGALEVEIMELPYAFRSTVETLPQRVPYISPPPGAPQLPSAQAGQLRVGLLWAASDWNVTRSVPVELLRPLGEVPGVQWYSLQQGRQREEWRTAGWPLESLAYRTEQIEQAAAAMQQLDLIITMDGMAAHLAGALGRPVWVMLKQAADWRWMEGRTDSPWYPTMRLFRQQTAGEWAAVIAAMAEALRAVVPAGS